MFAAISLQHLEYSLLPSAFKLYSWIGAQFHWDKSVEIDLSLFQDFSSKGRSRPYCMNQIVKAFRQLVSFGLVAIEREYDRTIYRARWFHPSEFKFKNGKFNLNSETKVEKNEPQTRTPSYSIKDFVDTPNTNAVDEENCEPEEELTPEEKSALKNFAEEATSLGVTNNENVRNLVKNYSWSQISAAFSLLKEKLQGFKPVKNRTGLFVAALKNGWFSESAPPPPPEFPPEWEPWLEEFSDLIEPDFKANSVGLVCYKAKHPDGIRPARQLFFPTDNEAFLDWIAV